MQNSRRNLSVIQIKLRAHLRLGLGIDQRMLRRAEAVEDLRWRLPAASTLFIVGAIAHEDGFAAAGECADEAPMHTALYLQSDRDLSIAGMYVHSRHHLNTYQQQRVARLDRQLHLLQSNHHFVSTKSSFSRK